MITLADLRDDERVITLKEILDVINEERIASGLRPLIHAKQMEKVANLARSLKFGGVAKIATPTYNPDGTLNKLIDTYHFTKRQAIIVAAKIDTNRLIYVVDKLEEALAQRDEAQDIIEKEKEVAQLKAELHIKELELKLKNAKIEYQSKIEEVYKESLEDDIDFRDVLASM